MTIPIAVSDHHPIHSCPVEFKIETLCDDVRALKDNQYLINTELKSIEVDLMLLFRTLNTLYKILQVLAYISSIVGAFLAVYNHSFIINEIVGVL